MRLANRVALHAVGYGGPLALKSFDPAIIAHFRQGENLPGPHNQPCPLGIVAQGHYDDEDWSALSADQKTNVVNFLGDFETRPDFLSYCVDDLPHAIPFLIRGLNATPVMAWTVRTQAQKNLAAQWADQIVFEGDFGH
jgi:hypothetical protein